MGMIMYSIKNRDIGYPWTFLNLAGHLAVEKMKKI
jgi:hypothetical protein